MARRLVAAALIAGAVLAGGAGQASAQTQFCAGQPCDLVLRTLCRNVGICLA